jgi:ABC-type multidrug transport system fused ATPase/permease subunit
MKKKILIGSLLVLALLLLMPSIPAIQQKTIDDGIKQELQEKLDEINLDDLKDFKGSDRFKHPFLYIFVISIMNIQILRYWINFLLIVLCCICADELGTSTIHPIIFSILSLRDVFLESQLVTWIYFWEDISARFGWNWGLIY